MSTESSDTYDTVGPDKALAAEDRKLADSLVEVVDDLPTLTEQEVADRYDRKFPANSIFRDERGTNGFEEQFRPGRLDLPGFGTERDDCGVEIPHVCDDCGHRVDVGRTCAQSRCPRCGPKWVIDRAEPIVSRIWSAAKMKDGAQYKHHAAISPPKDLYVDAENPEEACISMLQDFCREINFDGVILYHPWSGDNDAEGFASEHEDDQGEWKKRVFSGRNWEGDVREELQHRPHFHLIGCCEWFPGGDVTTEIYDQTGWVVHRITQRNGSPISLGGIDDVARAVTYALSHVGIDTRGERNYYVHGKVGSAYHNADDRHHDMARRAIHAVAPDTLGIPSMEVECKGEVPEDERDHDHEPDLLDGDDGDESSTSSDDSPGMTSCRGDLVDVDDADFVDDQGWQQRALYADEAVEARREWKEAGGWQGWLSQQTGQATLPSDPGDDPPPD